MIFSILAMEANAQEDIVAPYVTSFSVTSAVPVTSDSADNPRATGLIYSYRLFLSKSGNTLDISGQTYGSGEVVKCGFKDLTIQRRKSNSDDWEDYYEYGNVYVDSVTANLSTTLVVSSGYQYRISCKHYAKKSLLVTQSISNTSNIVIV